MSGVVNRNPFISEVFCEKSGLLDSRTNCCTGLERCMTALQQDLDLISSTRAHCLTPVQGGSDALIWPPVRTVLTRCTGIHTGKLLVYKK